MDSAFKALLIGYRLWGVATPLQEFLESYTATFLQHNSTSHTLEASVRECNTMLYERELE
jgi:hypothetical protein